MNFGALIIGIGFFITAVFDWNGDPFLFTRKFRDTYLDRADSEVKAWQKKRVSADALVGTGSTIASFFKAPDPVFFAGAAAAAAGLAALLILDGKFKKGITEGL